MFLQGDVLDEAGLKRLILMLEKRVLKNQELRIKFPEAPDKFMESEVELHQTIQVFSIELMIINLSSTLENL